MLDRTSRGLVPKKPHLRFENPRGGLYYEECLTRSGFEGAFSMLYHEHRPHEALPIETTRTMRAPAAVPARHLLRRHYRTLELPGGGPPLEARRPLLFNEDVVLSLLRPTEPDPTYVVNADGDDVYFVHRGGGVLESVFGRITFSTGDYVVVPKGVIHRFSSSAEDQAWLAIECRHGVGLPARYRNAVGQLRMDAPYSHRDFRRPELAAPLEASLCEMVVKREDRLHGFRSRQSPLDAVGWDGAVYPFAFPIGAFQPRVGQVHLPPPVHATFEAEGALVCSFVPRLLDFHPRAQPIPYPHASVDMDEVLFYANDAFGSRRGIAEGSLSHHPAGIPHGPHPGAYEEAPAADRTEELAVMLDCTRPLAATPDALAVEDAGYHESFVG
jgi:homogentisate 1,2-dioxygenase